MRLLAASALLLLATPALAQPAPAGSCRLDEGLVAQVTPPKGPGEENPRVLSMTLPRMANAVADISFHIAADGTATDLKFLCLRPEDAKLEMALRKASRSWKFVPMKHQGKPAPSDATYRVSASGMMPLSFQPQKLRPAQGGRAR